MQPEHIDQINVHTVLILKEMQNRIDSAIRCGIICIEKNEKGYKFKRMHPYHNGEEIFLNRQNLEGSHWTLPETPYQTCFQGI